MKQISNTQPQKIAVVGMGGMGSAFAFQLARVGHHDVTAIARMGSRRFDQLRNDGGVTKTDGEHAAMHVPDYFDACNTNVKSARFKWLHGWPCPIPPCIISSLWRA